MNILKYISVIKICYSLFIIFQKYLFSESIMSNMEVI